MGFTEDYWNITMDGVPRAWYRHVPAEVQERVMQMDPRLRIVRYPAPPNQHLCISRYPGAFVHTPAGTISGWYSIEDKIRGGTAGLDAFIASAQKNYREWEERGGPDQEKQYASQKRDERDISEDRKVKTLAEWDDAEREFWRGVDNQKVYTGPGILPGDSIMGPDGAPRRVRRA